MYFPHRKFFGDLGNLVDELINSNKSIEIIYSAIEKYNNTYICHGEIVIDCTYDWCNNYIFYHACDLQNIEILKQIKRGQESMYKMTISMIRVKNWFSADYLFHQVDKYEQSRIIDQQKFAGIYLLPLTDTKIILFLEFDSPADLLWIN